MRALRRLLAVVIGLTAAALAIHSIAGEIYGLYLAQSNQVWGYLNWFLGLGMVIALVYHFGRKRALDRSHQDDNVTMAYLTTNFLLFASVFLTLWFFANWFTVLGPNESLPGTLVGFVWISFNALFVPLGLVTAWMLWRHPLGEVAAPDASEVVPASTAADAG